MNKKRIFAAILFVVAALFTYAFANPSQDTDEGKKEKTNIQEQQEVKEDPKEETKEEDQTENTSNSIIRTNTTILNRGNNTGNLIDISSKKTQAKEELKAYADSKNIDSKYSDTLNDILSTGYANIDKSGSEVEILSALEAAKEEIDKLVLSIELDKYKETLIKELNDYYDNLDFSDKSETDSESQKLLNKGITNINNATTKNGALDALNKAKDELDELKANQDLNALKIAAKEELNNYYLSLNFKDADQADSTSKNALNDGLSNIDNAKSADEINEKLIVAKEELTKLKDIEILNTYKDNQNFNSDFITEANAIVTEGTNNINNNVKNALEDAKNKLDELKNKQILAEAKKKAITDLNNYKNSLGFTANYLEQANQVVSEGTGKINSASSVADVNSLYTEYCDKLDKLRELMDYQSETKFNITFSTYTKSEYAPYTKKVCVFGLCTDITVPAWKDVTYPKLTIKGINKKIFGFIPELDIVSVKYDNNEIYNDYYIIKNTEVDKDEDITNVKYITIKYMILGDGIFAGTYEAKYEIKFNSNNERYVVMISNNKN